MSKENIQETTYSAWGQNLSMAKLIADSAGLPKGSQAGRPEDIIERSIRWFLKGSHTPEGWKLFGRMVSTVLEHGIKVNLTKFAERSIVKTLGIPVELYNKALKAAGETVPEDEDKDKHDKDKDLDVGEVDECNAPKSLKSFKESINEEWDWQYQGDNHSVRISLNSNTPTTYSIDFINMADKGESEPVKIKFLDPLDRITDPKAIKQITKELETVLKTKNPRNVSLSGFTKGVVVDQLKGVLASMGYLDAFDTATVANKIIPAITGTPKEPLKKAKK